jgi:6-phosphofructokinase 1
MLNDKGLTPVLGLNEAEEKRLLLRAMRSSHAHLLFGGPNGSVRNFEVRNPYLTQALAREQGDGQAIGWDERVAVTNDVSILEYLAAAKQAIPYFPAAGDRPRRFLNPNRIRAGLVNAGGPAPGLNVVNDSITKRLFELASDAKRSPPSLVGYRRGFQGLCEHEKSDSKVQLVPSHRLVPKRTKTLDYAVTDDFASHPVTFLKSSRFKLDENLKAVAKAVIDEELDVLFVCGGDGSFRGTMAIKAAVGDYKPKNAKELVVICGPKTMDWDLQFTDTTFGFTTTVDYLVDAIRTFHQTIECQDRVGVMQVFGAASGFVALYAAYCSGEVDFVILPEEVEREGINALLGKDAGSTIDKARFDGLSESLRGGSVSEADVYEKGFDVCFQKCLNRVATRLTQKGHALVVVAEGAPARFSHGKAKRSWANVIADFKRQLAKLGFGGVQVTDIEPRYLIRDNPPRSYDTALCKFIGKAMVDAAVSGYTDCMVARWCGRYVLVPLDLATKRTSQVDPEDYFYRSMVGRYQLD